MKMSAWTLATFAAILGFACAVSCAQDTVAREMLKLGDAMPDFALKDVVTGKEVSSKTLAEKKVKVVISMCRHCPYVVHVMDGLVKFGNDYAGKDVGIAGISVNDPKAYPADSPESLKEMAVEKKLPFPLFHDESQDVGLAFTFVATPEFFVFDEKNTLRYRGQFDDSRPGSARDIPVTGKDVRAAVDALLAGEPVAAAQKRAIGCSIKWKEGKQPSYR